MRWNWKEEREQLYETRRALERIEAEVKRLAARPEPDAFVAMVVLAQPLSSSGPPMLVGGDVIRLTPKTESGLLCITVNTPYLASQAIVLCDLSIVQVDSIMAGDRAPAMNLGSGAPFAYLGKLVLGEQVRAFVRRWKGVGTT